MCRVLIANYQPIVRHGVRAPLANEPDLEVVGEADSGCEAVRLARELRPDVVVIDLLMPTLDGIAATRRIRAELPETQVVVMTGANDDASAIESLRAGAAGYLQKDVCIEVLLHAIRCAAGGQLAVPVQAVARLVRVVSRNEALSERETEVLCLVGQGLANKQIAGELCVSQSTVKSHVSRILGKLCLQSRTQVAMYAARTGLIVWDQALDRITSQPERRLS